jgi:hypothetical protein
VSCESTQSQELLQYAYKNLLNRFDHTKQCCDVDLVEEFGITYKSLSPHLKHVFQEYLTKGLGKINIYVTERHYRQARNMCNNKFVRIFKDYDYEPVLAITIQFLKDHGLLIVKDDPPIYLYKDCSLNISVHANSVFFHIHDIDTIYTLKYGGDLKIQKVRNMLRIYWWYTDDDNFFAYLNTCKTCGSYINHSRFMELNEACINRRKNSIDDDTFKDIHLSNFCDGCKCQIQSHLSLYVLNVLSSIVCEYY